MKKILIVDDVEMMREMLRSILKNDADVFLASNGEEALEKFRERQPDLVISDVDMPGMDGMKLLRIIKAESPETPVIIMSGLGETPEGADREQEALKEGAVFFWTKSSVLEFRDRVREILK